MRDHAVQFHDRIVRPVTAALADDFEWLDITLTGAALYRGFSTWQSRPGLHGVYGLTGEQHRNVWDGFLAYHPELASRVRGFASQRQFLEDPDLELSTNFSYSTAVALALFLWRRPSTPPEPQPAALARLWFQGTDQQGCAELHAAYRQLLHWLPPANAA